MHHYVIETDRLRLRPLTLDDAEAEFAWVGDPKVNRYMPYNLYTSVQQVREYLAGVVADTSAHLEFGFERRSDGLLIGAGSVGPNEAENAWEIGYNLRADCWNQGYTTEAARALIDFARHTFGATDFFAAHATANPASGRVMEHCGMTFDHFCEYSRFDGSETFPAKSYRMHLDAPSPNAGRLAGLAQLLTDSGADFTLIRRQKPILSAQDAAECCDPALAAPSLVAQTERGLMLMIVSSTRGRLDFGALKAALGLEKLKLADPEKVRQETGFAPGAIPLVGTNLPCIFDDRLRALPCIYGGSGDERVTLKIAPGDARRLNDVRAGIPA